LIGHWDEHFHDVRIGINSSTTSEPIGFDQHNCQRTQESQGRVVFAV
jgi:hypothetical protein